MQVYPSTARASFTFITLILLFQTGGETNMADSFEFVGELRNFTDAELECRRRGFDGLAVISSPEEFNFTITASIELR